MVEKAVAGATKNTECVKTANAAAREAIEISKTTMKMLRDMKHAGTQDQNNAVQTYAGVAARGELAASIHNPQNHRASSVQTLREIIVNIRAMSPRGLKAHVDRAIEQSNNEHLAKIKVVSSNQLKSGDLGIKTATTTDMEALRQFAEDW